MLARRAALICMPGFASINKSGGGLVVKMLHQCVLQTQARTCLALWSLLEIQPSGDDAEIVSSNLTRRVIFLPNRCISLTMLYLLLPVSIRSGGDSIRA
jgi:hypothetical protein